MNNNQENLLKQLSNTKFEGEVGISIYEKPKRKNTYGAFKMIGVQQNTSINFLKAMRLIAGHKWRTYAFIELIEHLSWGTNVSTLPDNLYKTQSDKVQLSAALKYLADNNIIIKLSRVNSKITGLPYRNHTWLINPKIIVSPDIHEVYCRAWKQITNNEP